MDEKIKEYVSLCYVSESVSKDDLSFLSKENGFLLQTLNDFLTVPDLLKQHSYDLVIVASDKVQSNGLMTLIQEIGYLKSSHKTAIFLSLPEYPESEMRVSFLNAGINDFLVQPIVYQEILRKIKIYEQVNNQTQAYLVQQKKLEKSFGYLEQFKSDLKNTKNQLFEERTTSNNALKQVHQMTQQRIQFKDEIKNLKQTLYKNIEGFMTLLIHLIRTRIEKNRGHGERVAHICKFIAKQLKFDEKKLEDLRKAAMLHEVGLLLIPREILNKPKGQLSEYEKDLFVQFPFNGADLLSSCAELNNCSEIIRNLNENSDGSGSPEGFKRRHIPLLSRILAGADLFDTLREGELGRSIGNLLENLETYSGSRLDPNIVFWLEKYAVLHLESEEYKVRGVGVHQLEPGMTLGTALFTNTGTKLFSVNTLLSQEAIDKIKKYNREYPVDETVYIRA